MGDLSSIPDVSEEPAIHAERTPRAHLVAHSFAHFISDFRLRDDVWLERRRQARLATREILAKSFALLVALAWSRAVFYHINTPRVALFVALSAYFAVWLAVRYCAVKFSEFTLSRFSMLSAEFVAFLWRDAVQRQQDWFAGDCEECINAGSFFEWALVLLAAGFLWVNFTSTLRTREWPWLNGDEEVRECLNEFMPEVEVDMHGLAIGWTIMAAVNELFLGRAWREEVEDNSDPVFYLYAFAMLLGLSSTVLILHLLVWCGTDLEGPLFLLVKTSCGFACGFITNIFWRVILHGSGTGMSVGRALYPLLMMVVGSIRVAMKRVPRETRRCEWSGFCRVYYNSIRHPWMEEVTVLTYQVCMALAFEECFEAAIEYVHAIGSVQMQYFLACVLTITWVLLVRNVLRKQARTHDVPMSEHDNAVPSNIEVRQQVHM